jgi:hypothetical protein
MPRHTVAAFKIVAVAFLVAFFVTILGRAIDHETAAAQASTVDQIFAQFVSDDERQEELIVDLQLRVHELELFTCGFHLYEDLSVTFEDGDEAREYCKRKFPAP